jgi:molybdopterin-synthase adenylyltransferase
MSRVLHSAAMTEETARQARAHLLRLDDQEDICFALWHPSSGRSRTSAIIERLVLPRFGDRNVHGNASFNPTFLERAMSEATATRSGLAMMHSHPLGRSWQGMSPDDVAAESGCAAAVFGATGFPFVGLTVAGDGEWSARFWERSAPHVYDRKWCGTVRVVGDRLACTYMDQLAPPPVPTDMQSRTVAAWGEESQAKLARLRIGVIGAGSVGGFIAEALARTGFEDVITMDFDLIKTHNLDRLMYATHSDVGRGKVKTLATHLQSRSTAERFCIEPLELAVFEEAGFRAALDCDVLVSCVDRPWGRHVMNLIAYAHLIPVIDGGIYVRSNRLGKLAAADWRAHAATVSRPCLQCLGQYDPGLVQTEREGNLDDPHYIEGLPAGHPLRVRENVFAFSMACASLQMLQLLALTLAPLDQPNPGAQRYHFVGGFMEEPQYGSCHATCLFPSLTARGDSAGLVVTGPRTPASTKPSVT